MKPTEIREMTDDELLDKRDELTRGRFNLRIQMATGQLDSTARLRGTRRDLARVKTIIRERGLEKKASAGGGARAPMKKAAGKAARAN
ncbi:MAG TPA: 50S ribosomal protein L29 [bacterium]|nr:50S ribosomal protein L29 [bacterium]